MPGADFNTPSFAPFQSGCSKCYPSTDYVKQNGGNKSLISTKDGKNFFKTPDFNVSMKTLVKNNSGKSYNTSAGGSKKKSNSNYMKGGNDDSKNIADFLKNVMDQSQATTSEELMSGGAKNKKVPKKKTKAPKKKVVKKKKGGMAPLDGNNDGMPVNAKFPNTGEFGMGQGAGTQMAVNSDMPNPLLKAMKAPPLSEEMQNKLIQMEMAGGATKKKKKSVSSLKKKTEPKKKTAAKKTVSKKTVAKKTKKTKKSKKMKGGEESWGATGMPAQFYDPKVPLASYASNSGKGAKSAYGAIQPNDIGTGMLAPFTTSKSKTANHATNMKTGGAKKTNKKGGSGLIPSMNTGPVKNISKIADKTYDSVKTFFKKLEKNYKTSVNKTKNIKIGNQRLVQGGSKKPVKKLPKKINKKKKGGDGSDWSMTANSRGPSNAPDTYFGVDGEKWFRNFNKTGEYIPNSKLANSAAPKLTSGPKINKVMGYSTYESTFAPIKGGAKKPKKKESVKKSKKTTATKKPKKKTASKKTSSKKTASKKK